MKQAHTSQRRTEQLLWALGSLSNLWLSEMAHYPSAKERCVLDSHLLVDPYIKDGGGVLAQLVVLNDPFDIRLIFPFGWQL